MNQENIKDTGLNYNSSGLLKFISIHKLPLSIVTIAALVISTVVSFLIEPQYKSSIILFPASSSSISGALLTQNLTEKEIMKFGEEEEVEQMIQMLNSSAIRDQIVKKYNLMSHYNIDSSGSFPKTKLYERYKDNVSVIRTEYMSVRIEVFDKDPAYAANIANDIAAFLDTVINTMQKERASRAFRLVEKEYLDLKRNIKLLEDSITAIRAKGILDYETQSEVFNDAYAKAISLGKMMYAKQIEEKLKVLQEYGGAYVSIRDLLEFEIKKLSELESKYREAKVDVIQDLPHKYVVSPAEKAERASFPVKWLVILVSTLSTAFLMLALLIITDHIKKKT